MMGTTAVVVLLYWRSHGGGQCHRGDPGKWGHPRGPKGRTADPEALSQASLPGGLPL